MARVWKLQHSPFLIYPTAFSQNTYLPRKWLSFISRAPVISTIWFWGGWTQWHMLQSSSIHCFWDTCQYFLKTHLCLESGFLLCLELQKSLLVSFQGCWTQWQRFESSSIDCFWDTCQHFLKTHFCLESGFLLFLVPEQRWIAYQYTNMADKPSLADGPPHTRAEMTCIPLHTTWKLNLLWMKTMAKFWKLLHSLFLRYLSHLLKTHFCLESGFLSFLVPEQRWLAYHYTQLGRWTYFGWTQWQMFESSSTHHLWDTP